MPFKTTQQQVPLSLGSNIELALHLGLIMPSGLQILDLVEWAIASHGMYESALVFIMENLYIVGCVQSVNKSIFTSARIKTLL